MMGNTIYDAWKIWTDKMGYPSEEHGYKLYFGEHQWQEHDWPYCWLPRPGDNTQWTWNYQVPSDTVVIQWQSGDSYMSSTTGWIPQEWIASAGRHGMYLNPAKLDNNPTLLTDLAHELGMIF
jgi:hypothetical protein